MLTSTSTEPRTLTLRIDVSSVVVRLALRYITEGRGWATCDAHGSSCDCLAVSDRPPRDAGLRLDVLVTKDTPAACQVALDAVLGGAARAVVLWDDPESLGAVVEAIQFGSVVIPERVIDLALEAPRLTERQRRTVHLIAAGRSNSEIAASLHQSTSTTKRDLAELMAVFDVTNRASLISATNRLGYL